MRLDDTCIDLLSALSTVEGRPLTGWRRVIEVNPDSVVISEAASSARAAIGRCTPDPWLTVHCKVIPVEVRPPVFDGWLKVDWLDPGHRFWIELDSLGLIRVEREDGSQDRRWNWTVPLNVWEKIR